MTDDPADDEPETVPTVEQVVSDWLAGTDISMIEVCMEHPEIAWLAINQLLTAELTKDQLAVLAAGPMEDLLVHHGNAFIDRVEFEASRNPRFNFLLGGVWQNSIVADIWDRIKLARCEVW